MIEKLWGAKGKINGREPVAKDHVTGGERSCAKENGCVYERGKLLHIKEKDESKQNTNEQK